MRQTFLSLAAWASGTAILLLLAYILGGPDGAETAIVAAVLCSAVTALSVTATEIFGRGQVAARSAVALGLVGVRMGLTLAGGSIVWSNFTQLRARGILAFWIWVITFYLFNLIWEVTHTVRGPSATTSPSPE